MARRASYAPRMHVIYADRPPTEEEVRRAAATIARICAPFEAEWFAHLAEEQKAREPVRGGLVAVGPPDVLGDDAPRISEND